MHRLLLFIILSHIISLSLQAAETQLRVGLSSTDVTPRVEDQIPLGGFGSLERRNWPPHLFHYPFLRTFRIAQGKLDPIRVKSMYLARENSKLLFVSLDVIGISNKMRLDLISRLKHTGIPDSNIIISATHTHSGPGGLSDNFFWQIFAMDRYQKRFYEKYMAAIVKTIMVSVYNTQPAELFTLSYATSELLNNRRGPNRPIDPTANFLMARNLNGEWLGGLVNYAVHGTSLGAANLFFSSDAPGSIEREMEQFLAQENGSVRLSNYPQVLFLNGAEGDISPKHDQIKMGKDFVTQTISHWNEIAPLTESWQVLQQKVYVGKPVIKLKKCVNESWMPKNLKIGVKRFVSNTTIINQIHFGPLWLMTWPGEPTTELGLQLKQMAKDSGAQTAWVLGLTNDHLAYFTSPEEYETGGYESCVNFFGPDGAKKIIQAHQKLSLSK